MLTRWIPGPGPPAGRHPARAGGAARRRRALLWLTHVERRQELASGSTRAVVSHTAARAARRAVAAYWAERPSLFEKVDSHTGEAIVVVQPAKDWRHDESQPATRWRCQVVEDDDGELSIHIEQA